MMQGISLGLLVGKANRNIEWLALLALLLIALLLRVYGIERYGLWIDEVATATCLDYTLPNVLDCSWAKIQSPLSHVVTDMLYTALGRPPLPIRDWLVRFPELLAGMSAIVVAWFVTRELLGTRAAWLNALLWTFSATAVVYSQEARSYAWLMLLSNLSAWFLLRGLRRTSLWSMLAFGVVAALNYYSHYLGAFVTAGLVLFAFACLGFEKKRGAALLNKRLLYLSAGVALSGLLVLPWLQITFGALSGLNSSDKFTRIPLSIGNALDAQTWLVFNWISIPFVGAALFALAVVGIVWMWKRARSVLLLCTCWFGFTIAFLVYRQSSFTAYRYWLVVQPPFYWLLTAGALALSEGITSFAKSRELRFDARAATALVSVGAILALLPALRQFYIDPFESYRFDDWRGAAAFLQANAQPNDLVLAFGETAVHQTMGLHYYLPRDTPLRLVEPDQFDGDLIAQVRTTHGRVWGITFSNSLAQSELGERISDQAETWSFRNLEIISLPPVPNETVSQNAQRLIALVRPLDAERFEIVDALLKDSPPSANLLVNAQFDANKSGVPRRWQFGTTRGQVVMADNEPVLRLSSASDQRVWAQQQIQFKPAQLYRVRFECRNTLPDGSQHLYITFDTPRGRLFVIPNGAGYTCPSGDTWHANEFVFRAPTPDVATDRATFLLRSSGSGDSYWRRLSVSPVNAP